jgi:thymidine phosphorylase
MLLRDAQEETRVVYAARQTLSKDSGDVLLNHISEAIEILESLKTAEKSSWPQMLTSKKRAVGLLLLIALGIANETEVDSFEALKSLLLEESP